MRKKQLVMPDYYLIPILLVIMSVAILGVIYWGALAEERRNREPRVAPSQRAG